MYITVCPCKQIQEIFPALFGMRAFPKFYVLVSASKGIKQINESACYDSN